MDEKKQIRTVKTDLPHNIIMENRSKISISGVENAESYNESEVVLHTSKGVLIIRGDMLNLSKLNLDSGEITVNGRICMLEYAEEKKDTEYIKYLDKLIAELTAKTESLWNEDRYIRAYHENGGRARRGNRRSFGGDEFFARHGTVDALSARGKKDSLYASGNFRMHFNDRNFGK